MWPTLAFALLVGVIAVAFTLWSMAWLQRRWATHGRLVGEAADGSVATYFVHPLFLTAIMVLVGPVQLKAEIGFLLVTAVAVPTCIAAGYGLARLRSSPWCCSTSVPPRRARSAADHDDGMPHPALRRRALRPPAR
jgi:hypothetical protein